MLRDKDYEFLKFAFLKAFIPASIRYVKSDYSDELNVYCEINFFRSKEVTGCFLFSKDI